MIVWLAFGALVFSTCEGWGAHEGLYFSFVTLTTIGLGDFFPSTYNGRIFLLLFAGVGMATLGLLDASYIFTLPALF